MLLEKIKRKKLEFYRQLFAVSIQEFSFFYFFLGFFLFFFIAACSLFLAY